LTQTLAQRRFVRLAGSMNTKAARLQRNGRVTPEDLYMAFMESAAQCGYCQIGITPVDCSFDHVVPFVAGGENTPDNIVACCLSCQRQKASRMAHEFALAREYKTSCEVCGTTFKPRWADHVRGYGRTCSAECAGKKGRLVRSGVWAR
jgi:hypothetical protein